MELINLMCTLNARFTSLFSIERSACEIKGYPTDLSSSFLQAQILAQFKPEIDTKKLIADLKKSDKLAADALLYFKKTRHIILYYEDVVSNDTVSPIALYILVLRLNEHLSLSKQLFFFFLQKLMDVLDFLRLPKRKLSSRHVKIHTKLLRDHIDNWAEVNSTLMGTQYESFLIG